MGLVSFVKNLLRKGGAKLGMVDQLGSILDHPKIDMDAGEYDRIAADRRYFEGDFKLIHYLNTEHQLKKRPYVSLNMLQVICRRMASLLYNEQAKITVDTSNSSGDSDDAKADIKDAANDFVQKVLGDNDFNKNFEYYLESCLALGGLAIRPYVDPVTKSIKLAWAQAPTFYPLKANTNNISSAAIATHSERTENGSQAYYTLLEFHEWQADQYTITNELYRSDSKASVGLRVPLGDIYPDLAETANLDTSVFTRPLFVYLKPAGFNNRNLSSPLGVGIADNARNTLRQINDTYDQFNWEVKMGQRRVLVPESTTQTFQTTTKDGKEQLEQVFDPDQNVFLKANLGMDNDTITDLTSDIRATDYIASLNHFLKTLEMQVGLSVGTFSFDGAGGLKTATEVVSEDSQTYQTRNSHLTMVERAIQELCVSICQLASGTVIDGQRLYSGPLPTVDQVSVDFDDGVFTDKKATADYWIALKAAGIVPDYVATARILGISEERAKEMLAEIADKTAAEVDPHEAGMFGDTDSPNGTDGQQDGGGDD